MKIKKETIINQLINSDARDILNILKDSFQIKSTITSPPYFDMKDYGSVNQIGYGQTYRDYLNDLKNIFQKIHTLTTDDGSLWIIIDTFKRNNQVVPLPFDLANKLKEVGWLLQDIIIWKKDKTVPWSNNGFVQRKFEYILFFSKSVKFKYNKDKVRNFDTSQLKKWWIKYPERYNPKGKALDEIWEFPIPVQGSWGSKYIRHFCPLPKEMVATMIDISTDPGDLILDPFAGTGSVLFQSAIMNRNYIGFELNENYIKMFNEYFDHNSTDAIKEYLKLQKLDSQESFQNKILNLRALKFGRVLVNELEKKMQIDLKVFVNILKYTNKKNVHLQVEYQLIGTTPNESILLEEALQIIKKPPLSKYGIEAEITLLKEKDLSNKKYYYYTSSNSYSYSNLPIASKKIKVISEICVNLDENNYD